MSQLIKYDDNDCIRYIEGTFLFGFVKNNPRIFVKIIYYILLFDFYWHIVCYGSKLFIIFSS